MVFESDRGSGWALGSARVGLNALLRVRASIDDSFLLWHPWGVRRMETHSRRKKKLEDKQFYMVLYILVPCSFYKPEN